MSNKKNVLRQMDRLEVKVFAKRMYGNVKRMCDELGLNFSSVSSWLNRSEQRYGVIEAAIERDMRDKGYPISVVFDPDIIYHIDAMVKGDHRRHKELARRR